LTIFWTGEFHLCCRWNGFTQYDLGKFTPWHFTWYSSEQRVTGISLDMLGLFTRSGVHSDYMRGFTAVFGLYWEHLHFKLNYIKHGGDSKKEEVVILQEIKCESHTKLQGRSINHGRWCVNEWVYSKVMGWDLRTLLKIKFYKQWDWNPAPEVTDVMPPAPPLPPFPKNLLCMFTGLSAHKIST